MQKKHHSRHWKAAMSAHRDAFDHDPHSVSNYDDSSNINGGVSPYAHDRNVSQDTEDHSLDLR